MEPSTSSGTRFDFTDATVSIPVKIMFNSSVLVYTVWQVAGKPERQQLFDDVKIFLARLEAAIVAGTCEAIAPSNIIIECFHFFTRKAIQNYASTNPQYINNKRVSSWEVVYKTESELVEKLGVPNILQNFLVTLKSTGIDVVRPEDLITSSLVTLSPKLLNI